MESALQRIPTEISNLLADYRIDLQEAWLKTEAGEALAISFSAKIKPKYCEVTMSFTKEKVKDTISFPWDDDQLTLLPQDEHEREEVVENE